MSLTEFLLAQLAADEAAALAASPSPWSFSGVESVAGGTLYDETRQIANVTYEQPEDHDGTIVRHLLVPEANANGTHIARHDPARVLADVKAKRAIVELHKNWPVLVESPPTFNSSPSDDLNAMTVKMSRQIMWATEQEYRNKFGTEPPTAPILRALAQPYRGADGWQEEWD